jgi:hypothetical protein
MTKVSSGADHIRMEHEAYRRDVFPERKKNFLGRTKLT